MKHWLEYLKDGLARQAPEDRFAAGLPRRSLSLGESANPVDTDFHTEMNNADHRDTLRISRLNQIIFNLTSLAGLRPTETVNGPLSVRSAPRRTWQRGAEAYWGVEIFMPSRILMINEALRGLGYTGVPGGTSK